MIGTTLGHYRVLERLGSGGMGEVYLCEDFNLGRRVALKVLSTQLALSPDHRARFEREARAVAALNHPNIVTIHSVEAVDGVQFITMELVEGRPLSELIPPGGLDVDRLLELALPLTEAVAAAHRAGIVHRDLKPENVMVSGEGRLKVLDFGLAKLREPVSEDDRTRPDSENLTKDGRIIGTASYMSPEQAEGGAVGPASDVFSLGIILYQMATGVRPFAGASDISTILAIIRTPHVAVRERNPAVPQALAAIIDRCLAKQPGERYAAAGELHGALAVLRSGEMTAVRPPRRSRPGWLPALAGAVLVAALAAAVWLTHDRGAAPAPVAGGEGRAPAIAVLPFRNLSGDADNEYFSDGITAEISNKLARLDSLEVASQTSVGRFKGSDRDVRAIGRELGVRYLLEGTVRKAGKRVRITAQLVDGNNGFQLWSDDFEGDLDDVFGVQETTALAIAEALDLRLSAGEQAALRRRATTSPEAFDEYLRGRALLEYFSSPDKLDLAGRHFARALELDPDYPLALVGMSRVEAQYHRNIDPSPARLERAEALARRALELDPDLAEAHLAMGQVLANHYRYGEAAERFRAALALEPDNAYAWDLLSWALAYGTPPDPVAAEDASRRSISLQPSLVGAHYHLGRALYLQGRFDEAKSAFAQAKSLDPSFESSDFGLGQILNAEHRYAEALAVFAGLDTLRRSPVVPVQVAIARAGSGDLDGALVALEEAFALGYSDRAALAAMPELEPLRENPRYLQLVDQDAGGS